MRHEEAPSDIAALAEERAVARRSHDWPTADALLARIEAAGWKVIDAGTLYDLERVAPPDVTEGEVIRFGSSASVPSRLDEPAVGTACVVLVAMGRPDADQRAMRSLDAHAPAGTQIVVVANGLPDDPATAAPRLTTELVRTSAPLGWAAALNAGIRRAAAEVVILLDSSLEPQGDLVTALVEALDDPTVAVAGPFGLVSHDLRRFEPAPGDAVDVDAIDGRALAFRRSDYVARGPLDEHFAFSGHLDTWWSLVLRDQGEEDAADAQPRRAVQVSSVPVVRHADDRWTDLTDLERGRLAKKDQYRFLKRFATRRDLVGGGGR
jgi:hypothetical protein